MVKPGMPEVVDLIHITRGLVVHLNVLSQRFPTARILHYALEALCRATIFLMVGPRKNKLGVVLFETVPVDVQVQVRYTFSPFDAAPEGLQTLVGPAGRFGQPRGIAGLHPAGTK